MWRSGTSRSLGGRDEISPKQTSRIEHEPVGRSNGAPAFGVRQSSAAFHSPARSCQSARGLAHSKSFATLGANEPPPGFGLRQSSAALTSTHDHRPRAHFETRVSLMPKRQRTAALQNLTAPRGSCAGVKPCPSITRLHDARSASSSHHVSSLLLPASEVEALAYHAWYDPGQITR